MVGAFRGFGCGERSAFEVEAEKRVGVEVVERCPGAVPVVGQFRVSTVARDAVLFPFGDVGF